MSNGCEKKIPCPLFITLNHFLQISQDHDYWMHLSFSRSTAGQRRITPVQRFKDFPAPSDRRWQSLILLNANCPLSRVHSRQTCAHTHIKYPVTQTWKCNVYSFWMNNVCIVEQKHVDCETQSRMHWETECVDCEWEQVVTVSVVHSFIPKELHHAFNLNLTHLSKAEDFHSSIFL